MAATSPDAAALGAAEEATPLDAEAFAVPAWPPPATEAVRPGDWLDTAPLLGFAGGPKALDLTLRARAAEPTHLAVALAAGLDAHPGAEVFALLDPVFSAAWERLLAVRARSGAPPPPPPPLHLALPNVRGLIREATEHGMLGAGMRRLLRMGPLGVVGLGLRNLGEAQGALRRRFPTLLRILTRVELAEARRLRPHSVLLQQQLTDLALAHGQLALLGDFARIVRGAGFAPGWVTANPHRLCEALSEAAAMSAYWLAAGPNTVVSLRPGRQPVDWPDGIRFVGPACPTAGAPERTEACARRPSRHPWPLA